MINSPDAKEGNDSIENSIQQSGSGNTLNNKVGNTKTTIKGDNNRNNSHDITDARKSTNINFGGILMLLLAGTVAGGGSVFIIEKASGIINGSTTSTEVMDKKLSDKQEEVDRLNIDVKDLIAQVESLNNSIKLKENKIKALEEELRTEKLKGEIQDPPISAPPPTPYQAPTPDSSNQPKAPRSWCLVMLEQWQARKERFGEDSQSIREVMKEQNCAANGVSIP